MPADVLIPARFCGPPTSANGGYAAGSLARMVPGPAEVTLRRPPPLDRPMTVVESGEGRLELRDGADLIAEAVARDVAVAVPDPVTWSEANAATAGYRGFEAGGTFNSCFVCGPDRADGLRIFPGPVANRDCVASPWTPDESVLAPDGSVSQEVVWAALDCPTFFASAEPGQLALLGRMAAVAQQPVPGRERLVVMAWPTGSDGRKRYGSSAILNGDGDVLAAANTTWITIDATYHP